MIIPNPELYNRQVLLIGKENQSKLSFKTVVLIGVGGLGSPIALYLSRIGIKKLILVDPDIVEYSNLSRQTMYSADDAKLKKSKVEIANEKLSDFCEIETHKTIDENDSSFMDNADLVIGAIDNWNARYKLNELCVKKKVPFIDIAVEGFSGHIIWVNAKNNKDDKTHNNFCIKCVFSKDDQKVKRPIPIINTTCIFAVAIALNQILTFFIDDKYPENKITYFNAKTCLIQYFEAKPRKGCVCSIGNN